MRQAAQPPERERVIDRIPDQRALRNRLERMPVAPEAVGPTELAIDEAPPRGPLIDTGGPTQRDAVQAEAVLDQAARAQSDRLGGEELELEPRRSDPLEISGLGEELEHLVHGVGQMLLALEPIHHYRATYV